MKRRYLFVIAALIVGAISLALLAAACGGGEEEEPTATEPQATEPADQTPAEGATTVDVSLIEFSVDLSTDTVPAGTVTFNLSNDGAAAHSFEVIRTDLAPDALPYDEETFMVDEEQVDIVGRVEAFEPGESDELTVDLEPGSYVLICNVATHYEAGSYTAFTVG